MVEILKFQNIKSILRNLASEVNKTTHGDVEDFLRDCDETPQNTPTFPELDIPISRTEILKSIKKLKSNKAHGPDTLMNKYFIESEELLCGHVEILFNKILDKGDFPKTWTQGAVETLHKKKKKKKMVLQ